MARCSDLCPLSAKADIDQPALGYRFYEYTPLARPGVHCSDDRRNTLLRAYAPDRAIRMNGRSPVGSTSTHAPFGIACVMSKSKPEIMVKSAKAAPCTMIGLTAFKTSAAGTTPRAFISCSIHAVATPPLAALSTSTRPT